MCRGDASQQASEFCRFGLGRGAAVFAEQEHQRRFGAGRGVTMLINAGKKGVAALNAMGKAVGDQEIQGTVDRDRAGAARLPGNAIHDLVGRDRRVTLQHRLQDLPSLLGEAQPLVAAAFLGARNGPAAADLMIMVGIVEQGSLQASSTVYSRPRRPEKD